MKFKDNPHLLLQWIDFSATQKETLKSAVGTEALEKRSRDTTE